MAVQYAATAALPLLLEPDPPDGGRRFWGGWRRRGGEPVRCYADDAQGAVAQWTVLVQRLTPISRKELAVILGQHVAGGTRRTLDGRQWPSYTAPVARALDRLGIGPLKGAWTGNEHGRPTEIAAACLSLLDEAADILDEQAMSVERRERLASDIRLLTSVRSLEPWRSRWPS